MRRSSSYAAGNLTPDLHASITAQLLDVLSLRSEKISFTRLERFLRFAQVTPRLSRDIWHLLPSWTIGDIPLAEIPAVVNLVNSSGTVEDQESMDDLVDLGEDQQLWNSSMRYYNLECREAWESSFYCSPSFRLWGVNSIKFLRVEHCEFKTHEVLVDVLSKLDLEYLDFTCKNCIDLELGACNEEDKDFADNAEKSCLFKDARYFSGTQNVLVSLCPNLAELHLHCRGHSKGFRGDLITRTICGLPKLRRLRSEWALHARADAYTVLKRLERLEVGVERWDVLTDEMHVEAEGRNLQLASSISGDFSQLCLSNLRPLSGCSQLVSLALEISPESLDKLAGIIHAFPNLRELDLNIHSTGNEVQCLHQNDVVASCMRCRTRSSIVTIVQSAKKLTSLKIPGISVSARGLADIIRCFGNRLLQLKIRLEITESNARVVERIAKLCKGVKAVARFCSNFQRFEVDFDGLEQAAARPSSSLIPEIVPVLKETLEEADLCLPGADFSDAWRVMNALSTTSVGVNPLFAAEVLDPDNPYESDGPSSSGSDNEV